MEKGQIRALGKAILIAVVAYLTYLINLPQRNEKGEGEGEGEGEGHHE